MILDPGNTKPCDKLFAVLSVDDQGNEGIIGVVLGLAAVPAVTSSELALQHYKKAAREMIGQTDKKFVVAEFTRSSTVEIKK